MSAHVSHPFGCNDWPEETGFVTASSGCLIRHAVKDLHGTDTNGTLTCALDFNHDGPHWDASEEVWWATA